MRTAEVILGLVVMLTAVALSFGAAGLVAPLPPAGLGLTLALTGLGATIAAHGMAGRAARAGAASPAVRWRAVFYALLTFTFAAALPLVTEALDLATIAGFPLGYYAAAQGVLIVFATLAFRAAMHLDAGEEDQPSSPGDG